MKSFLYKPTQQLRILSLLLTKPHVMVYEFMTPRPQGLGIAQYNARIKELREYGYDIESVEKGKFKLHRHNLSRILSKIEADAKIVKSIGNQEKLNQLRAEYLMVKKADNEDLQTNYQEVYGSII